MKHKTWWKSTIFGFILGILVPLLSSFIIYRSGFRGAGNYLFVVKELFALDSLGKLLSISVVPNLIIFFISIRRECYKISRGIVLATMAFALVAVFLFFWN